MVRTTHGGTVVGLISYIVVYSLSLAARNSTLQRHGFKCPQLVITSDGEDQIVHSPTTEPQLLFADNSFEPLSTPFLWGKPIHTIMTFVFVAWLCRSTDAVDKMAQRSESSSTSSYLGLA